MIREDRELLAELARLNGDMASLALRIMDGSAGVDEQSRYALRLIATSERLVAHRYQPFRIVQKAERSGKAPGISHVVAYAGPESFA